VNILKAYFARNFSYCEFYRPLFCCKQSPCARAKRIKFSKNHDFGLVTPIRSDVPYLIQYRSFLPSIVSAYEVFVKNGQEDSNEAFRLFALDNAEKYVAFIEKWISGPNAPNDRLIVQYEVLTSNTTIECLKRVISFFQPESEINEVMLIEIARTIKKVTVDAGKARTYPRFGIRDTRHIEDFRFFDANFFDDLAMVTSKAERGASIACADERCMS
jgi:hypothetical protein